MTLSDIKKSPFKAKEELDNLYLDKCNLISQREELKTILCIMAKVYIPEADVDSFIMSVERNELPILKMYLENK